MNITLCTNNSEANKLSKSLSNQHIYSGSLKQETSIIEPQIIVEVENPSGYNYAYIPDFSRYYFITDMVAVRTNLWNIQLKCDPLQSFRNYLLDTEVILQDTEETGSEMYLTGEAWKSKVKELTDIKSFPNGLSDTGNFILITAGG